MMSFRTRTALVSCTVVAAAGWFAWELFTAAPEPAISPPEIPVPGSAPPEQPSKPAATRRIPAPDSPEFREFVMEKCLPWLETRGRDAAGLIALWDLSGDTAVLKEAAEKHPDDPRVGIAMISWLFSEGKDALPWIEKLIVKDPDNPAGLYFKARSFAKSGRTEEALAALEAATRIRGYPSSYLRERTATAREAVFSGGGSPRESSQGVLTAMFQRGGFQPFDSSLIGLLKKSVRSAREAGNPGAAEKAAIIGAVAAEQLRLNPAPVLLDELIGLTVLGGMLKEIDPLTEYGDGGKTAGDRLREIEAEKATMGSLVKGMQDFNGWIDGLSDAEVSGYVDQFLLHGERRAMIWLKQKHGARP